jgi:hypothetical protein
LLAGPPTEAFEIEHFRPKGPRAFRRFRNAYDNLLWACRECNLAKGDNWPTKAEFSHDDRFVDPCTEGLGAHLRLMGDRVDSVAGSRAGAFMITEINLNSALHRRRRTDRDKAARAFAMLEAYDESTWPRNPTRPAQRRTARTPC